MPIWSSLNPVLPNRRLISLFLIAILHWYPVQKARRHYKHHHHQSSSSGQWESEQLTFIASWFGKRHYILRSLIQRLQRKPLITNNRFCHRYLVLALLVIFLNFESSLHPIQCLQEEVWRFLELHQFPDLAL